MKIVRIHRFFSVLVCSMGITGVVFAQQPQKNLHNAPRNYMPTVTQELVKSIPIFIEQARALGFSDQEIAQTLDQVVKNGLTEQGLADFVKALNTNETEEKEPSYLMYLVLACGGIIVGWLLYQLYQSIVLKNTREAWLTTDPEDAIPVKKLRAAEERIRRALDTDEEPKSIVMDLAGEYEGVCVKARWNNGGAYHNVSFEF